MTRQVVRVDDAQLMKNAISNKLFLPFLLVVRAHVWCVVYPSQYFFFFFGLLRHMFGVPLTYLLLHIFHIYIYIK